jgi:hypothetical protein
LGCRQLQLALSSLLNSQQLSQFQLSLSNLLNSQQLSQFFEEKL